MMIIVGVTPVSNKLGLVVTIATVVELGSYWSQGLMLIMLVTTVDSL